MNSGRHTATDLAKRYDVAVSTITRAAAKATWRHSAATVSHAHSVVTPPRHAGADGVLVVARCGTARVGSKLVWCFRARNGSVLLEEVGVWSALYDTRVLRGSLGDRVIDQLLDPRVLEEIVTPLRESSAEHQPAGFLAEVFVALLDELIENCRDAPPAWSQVEVDQTAAYLCSLRGQAARRGWAVFDRGPSLAGRYYRRALDPVPLAPAAPNSGNVPRFVYVFGADTVPAVKIGIAADPRQRCRQIEIDSYLSATYRVLAAIPGTYQLESFLHKRYARWCIRGEWYERNEHIEALVEAMRQSDSEAALRAFLQHPLSDDGSDGFASPGK